MFGDKTNGCEGSEAVLRQLEALEIVLHTLKARLTGDKDTAINRMWILATSGSPTIGMVYGTDNRIALLDMLDSEGFTDELVQVYHMLVQRTPHSDVSLAVDHLAGSAYLYYLNVDKKKLAEEVYVLLMDKPIFYILMLLEILDYKAVKRLHFSHFMDEGLD